MILTTDKPPPIHKTRKAMDSPMNSSVDSSVDSSTQLPPLPLQRPPSKMPPSEVLLKAERLFFSRGGQPLLEDVSMTLRRGEIVTLLGPNGGGKTTLLQSLLGLHRVSRGKVVRAKGLRIGYVPQRMHPSPLMPLSLRRFARLGNDAPAALVDRRCSELGLSHLASQPLHVLSGGELQKAMLARATAKEPNCLVLDEPLSGIDAAGRQHLYGWLERYSRQHDCAILMASHDLHLVMAATDRVLCLDRRIRCEGKPQHVAQSKAFSQLFGSDRYALYAHRHDATEHS